MLHRFEDSETGVHGHHPTILASHLEYLRKEHFHLSSLSDLIARLSRGEPPLSRTVVFTVDDGYADFLSVGAPIFERFDCPVTSFVTTGFLDGQCWLWYDAVEHLLGKDGYGSIRLKSLNGRQLQWSSSLERNLLAARFIEELKGVPTRVVEDVVTELVGCGLEDLPHQPPAPYAPISWDDARIWAARGVEFGPHTHTHPILSRCNEERARTEIITSWSRLRQEVPSAVPFFCYPVGMPSDFTNRERLIAAQAGLHAAVSAFGGHCTLKSFVRDPFALPRISYEQELGAFRQAVVGLERFKSVVRAVAQ